MRSNHTALRRQALVDPGDPMVGSIAHLHQLLSHSARPARPHLEPPPPQPDQTEEAAAQAAAQAAEADRRKTAEEAASREAEAARAVAEVAAVKESDAMQAAKDAQPEEEGASSKQETLVESLWLLMEARRLQRMADDPLSALVQQWRTEQKASPVTMPTPAPARLERQARQHREHNRAEQQPARHCWNTGHPAAGSSSGPENATSYCWGRGGRADTVRRGYCFADGHDSRVAAQPAKSIRPELTDALMDMMTLQEENQNELDRLTAMEVSARLRAEQAEARLSMLERTQGPHGNRWRQQAAPETPSAVRVVRQPSLKLPAAIAKEMVHQKAQLSQLRVPTSKPRLKRMAASRTVEVQPDLLGSAFARGFEERLQELTLQELGQIKRGMHEPWIESWDAASHVLGFSPIIQTDSGAAPLTVHSHNGSLEIGEGGVTDVQTSRERSMERSPGHDVAETILVV